MIGIKEVSNLLLIFNFSLWGWQHINANVGASKSYACPWGEYMSTQNYDEMIYDVA